MIEIENLAKSPKHIHLLPEHLIDQIKAGEVIESPTSLIKELLENSLDAYATEIRLQVSADFITSLSLSDNGTGIYPKDLPLAFTRHATSKLSRFQDLQQLGTFGFRGEALASMGAVAKIAVKSKTSTSARSHLEIAYGEVISHYTEKEKTSSDHGTQIIVTELFSKVPARLKFLQSQSFEKNKFMKMWNHYLIAYPHVEFHLQLGDSTPLFWSKKNSHEERLASIWKTTEHNIKKESTDYAQMSMTLYRAVISSSSKKSKFNFIFVNSRPILMPALHGFLHQKLHEHEQYCLLIKTASEEIDVNVHPAKTEVKFFDRSLLFSLCTQLTQKILAQEPLLQEPKMNPSENVQANVLPSPSSFNHSPILETGPKEYPTLLATTSKEILVLTFEHKVTHLFFSKKWIRSIMSSFLNNKNSAETSNSLPLIVSLPVEVNICPNEEILNFWLEKGLDVEISNVSTPKTLRVKAIPSNWSYLSLIQFLPAFFAIFCNLNSKNQSIVTLSVWQQHIMSEMENWDEISFLQQLNNHSFVQEESTKPFLISFNSLTTKFSGLT